MIDKPSITKFSLFNEKSSTLTQLIIFFDIKPNIKPNIIENIIIVYRPDCSADPR